MENALGSVGILAFWIRFPHVTGEIVLLNRRTCLLTLAVIVEITAGQTILLRWSRTAAGTERMTALTWV